jgi:type IX secretion system PorP/SprF family membrane protein
MYSRNLYAGLSFISVDPQKTLGAMDENAPNRVRHYFGTVGYAWEVSPDVVLKPSVMLKYAHNAPVEADINLNVLLSQIIWIGGSYRTGDSFVAMVEFQLTRKLKLGYSYDFTTTDVKDFSSGSHEIMLGYDFGYDIMKIKTPRYF